ncbi:MAG TPA: S8 family serine peptidase [Gaiellaceae bacterium]|nr:S8 family serine peptidase [Gaiellaceae bacterium]
MQRKSRIRALCAAFFLAAGLAFAGASPAAADGPPGFLCGLNPVVSALIGCATAAPAQQQQQQQAQSSSSSSSSSAPASDLQAAPPVAFSSTKPTYLPGVLLVRFKSGVSYRRGESLLAGLGAQTQVRIPQLRTRIVSVDAADRNRVLARLRASRLVADAHLDELLHTSGVMLNDTFFSRQWGLKLAGFTTAWAKTHGTRPVVVAVLDTGVNASAPDLAGVVHSGADLVNGDGSAADDNGHGTAVAGVIAALGNNGIGGAGVCWKCSILPIKVMGADGNGDLATVAAGIVRATDMGAKVIDLSLGGPAGEPTLQQAVAYAASKGVLVVAAAGNSGLATPFYPANYPGVISVGGTDPRDSLYGWSEHGPWVRVSAPGCNVAPLLHGGYGEFCGTSSATPMVAGLAGYLLSVRPTATPVQLVAVIEKTARRIRTGVQFGRIDAAAALAALGR